MNNCGCDLKTYSSGIKSFMSLISNLLNKVMRRVSMLNLKYNSVNLSLNIKKLKSLYKLCPGLLKCFEIPLQLLLKVLLKKHEFK